MLDADFDVRPLGYAVIVQAVKDAKQGDKSARLWLATDGLFYLGALGSTIDDDIIRQFINRLRKRTGKPRASVAGRVRIE